MAFLGVLAYVMGLVLLGAGYHPGAAVAAGVVAVLLLTARRFAHTLLFSPGVIAASSLYSMTHFYPLWDAADAPPLAGCSTSALLGGRHALAGRRSGHARARRCMVGVLRSCRHRRVVRRDLSGGRREAASRQRGSPLANNRVRAQHRADRFRHVARRPALRRWLSPRAHAQSGAARQARHAVHGLLCPVCADGAEPGHPCSAAPGRTATACATPS